VQTPTAAADLQAAVKKALHSAVHLPAPAGPFSFNFYDHGAALILCTRTESHTHTFDLQREHVPKNPANAGRWYGTECRKDAHGRRWSHWLPDHVVDDFGTLVPVQVAA